MKQQQIKEAVCEVLTNLGYEVLDLSFKTPCDSCDVIENWDRFNVLPDFLLKKSGQLFFSFLLVSSSNHPEIASYIKKYSVVLPMKLFQVCENNLYELKNINDTSNKELICSEIKVKKVVTVGMSRRTFKSEKGQWEEKRKIGLIGEKEVINLLQKSKVEIIDLNFNAPCDTCSNIQNWRQYNKNPDGIAITKTSIFFFDAKAKKSRKLIINERDYNKYIEKLKFLPTNVFFVILTHNLKVKEIYSHRVNNNKHLKRIEWDRNVVVDVSNEVEQLS